MAYRYKFAYNKPTNYFFLENHAENVALSRPSVCREGKQKTWTAVIPLTVATYMDRVD